MTTYNNSITGFTGASRSLSFRLFAGKKANRMVRSSKIILERISKANNYNIDFLTQKQSINYFPFKKRVPLVVISKGEEKKKPSKFEISSIVFDDKLSFINYLQEIMAKKRYKKLPEPVKEPEIYTLKNLNPFGIPREVLGGAGDIGLTTA